MNTLPHAAIDINRPMIVRLYLFNYVTNTLRRKPILRLYYYRGFDQLKVLAACRYGRRCVRLGECEGFHVIVGNE